MVSSILIHEHEGTVSRRSVRKEGTSTLSSLNRARAAIEGRRKSRELAKARTIAALEEIQNPNFVITSEGSQVKNWNASPVRNNCDSPTRRTDNEEKYPMGEDPTVDVRDTTAVQRLEVSSEVERVRDESRNEIMSNGNSDNFAASDGTFLDNEKTGNEMSRVPSTKVKVTRKKAETKSSFHPSLAGNESVPVSTAKMKHSQQHSNYLLSDEALIAVSQAALEKLTDKNVDDIEPTYTSLKPWNLGKSNETTGRKLIGDDDGMTANTISKHLILSKSSVYSKNDFSNDEMTLMPSFDPLNEKKIASQLLDEAEMELEQSSERNDPLKFTSSADSFRTEGENSEPFEIMNLGVLDQIMYLDTRNSTSIKCSEDSMNSSYSMESPVSSTDGSTHGSDDHILRHAFEDTQITHTSNHPSLSSSIKAISTSNKLITRKDIGREEQTLSQVDKAVKKDVTAPEEDREYDDLSEFLCDGVNCGGDFW